jgi:type II secretory pathway component GspD/PulD (secretin)
MRRLGLPTAATSLIVLLAACGDLPAAKNLPSPSESHRTTERRFVEAQSEAVTVIPVSRNAFRPVSLDGELRADLASTPLDLKFPGRATLGDLVAVLGSLNVPIVVNRDAGMQDALTQPLPFSSYKGRLGELLDILRRASSVISVQRGDFIYLGTLARYSVDLPQNSEIMDTIAGEIQSLGGSEVVKSVTGGQLIYQAKPDVHDTLINPYLDRISDNLAMVTMQVAVVSLAVNDSTSQGFDWNAFKLRIDGREEGGSTGTGESTGALPDLPSLGGLIDASASAVSIGRTGTGQLFGRAATYTIGAALNFLSTFGETEITQNVELKTIAGQEVTLRSGQEVPYVSGVSSTTTGDSTTGAAETKTVQTGLTVGLSPFYDSGTGLVTLEMDLEQRQILQFIELSAGNDVGTITQPLTQDQKLTDLIRVPVGQTIVVGGLQNENYSTTGTEPSFLRKALPEEAQFGTRSRNVSRTAFFIVVRPTVTVFERR